MTFKDLKGAYIATSVYAAGDQIGVNIPVTLPEITPVTAEIQAAGGKIELPVWQKVEAMEASITLTGIDKNFLRAMTPEPFDLIINIAQQSVAADGSSSVDHIKVFLRVVPRSAPSLAVTPDESGENELPFSVLSYQLYLNGEKLFEIDVLKGKCLINGKDYSKAIHSIL